jgi:hypothetical protein
MDPIVNKHVLPSTKSLAQAMVCVPTMRLNSLNARVTRTTLAMIVPSAALAI